MYEKLKNITKQILPASFISNNEAFIRKIVALRYLGNQFKCNLCNYNLSSFIELSNRDLLCPSCGVLPRTRRLISILHERFTLNGKKLLHFSPPRALAKRLRQTSLSAYVTTDYMGEFNADKKLDIVNMDEQDEAYDLIICYHVLEHIEQDNLAMKELHRVLKTGGCCLIQTPFKTGKIFEDSSFTSEADRLKHFGQRDHVRIYSPGGLQERLQNAGFKTEALKFNDQVNNYNGLKLEETVILARK